MTVVGDMHADHGATFLDRAGRRVVDHYGRPERTHHAVRNGAGVVEMGYGVVVVEGEDRHEFVDDSVSNRVPAADGEGVYALLLDPQGCVRTDMYVYATGERLLVFTPPVRAGPLVEDWSGKTFIQDVTVREATGEFGIFGVHGPKATEKVASVLNGAGAPEPALSFVRGSIHDAGVTVVAADAPAGEEGYEVVCRADDAADVFDSLLTRGYNAVPFGARTWRTLTIEAGTPLYESELAGRLPNVLGLANAVDYDKGCFVGQEVVSKVHNRGRPSGRLVGLRPQAVPDAGATVRDDDGDVGEVTRAVESPALSTPVALAVLDHDAATADVALSVVVEGQAVPAERVPLPFVDGSARSARIPRYE